MTPNPASTFSFRGRKLRISNLRIAAIVSLVIHALMFLSAVPQMNLDRLQPFEEDKDGKPAGSLAVRLVPPTSRHAEQAPMIPRAPALQAPRVVHSQPAPSPAKTQSPPVLARERTGAPPTVATPTPGAPGDLASFIEARRRERDPSPAAAAPAQPAETQQERDNRQAAENLGFNRVPTFGAGRKTGGGIFQVSTMRYDSAEFFFFGWNKMIRRNAQQMIEVRKGDNATIELAVVRRMIAIIRDQSKGDIIWESVRLNREISLSARPEDNAGLEEFLLKEFFPDYFRR